MAKKPTKSAKASKLASPASGTISTTEPSFEELRDRSIQHRYEGVFLADYRDSLANGDPDNGNAQRTDEVNGQGLMTGVCQKRKIRNMVEHLVNEGMLSRDFYDIYVRDGGILNDEHRKGYEAIGLTSEMSALPKLKNGDEPFANRVGRWMCQHYYDVRTFGAMMATKINVRSYRGPVQITMARSFHPVTPWDLPITRVAVTTRKEHDELKEHMMGRQESQPYGLFCTHIYVSALLARNTGFSEEDLQVLWNALQEMLEHDHSAARGDMACRGLYIFKHATRLGNAKAKDLVSRVTATLKDETKSPRCFEDYDVHVDRDNLPEGIELIEYV